MRAIVFFASLLAITACTAADQRRLVQIDGQTVNYGPVPAASASVPDGLTPLLFTFSQTERRRRNGVTDAEFAQEAARRGISVETLSISMADDPYIGPDGQMRVCTIRAIQRGLCRGPKPLSVAERVRIAERVLEGDPNCTWAGFDPAYNRQMSRSAGAAQYTLWLAAAC
ncbi:MAG: hypothetical protein AAGF60_05460 [Pseudomonadota bacterium]